jgi:hypothetical protein
MICGVEERDLGMAYFKSNIGPFNPTPVSGVVIFDATNGSLRLTERLGHRLVDVVAAALDQADDDGTRNALLAMHRNVLILEPKASAPEPPEPVMDKEWVKLIGSGQPAMYLDSNGTIQVNVLGYRYTPHGVLYELENLPSTKFDLLPDGTIGLRPPAKWMVLASHIQPIHGTTEMIAVNLMSGEERPAA